MVRRLRRPTAPFVAIALLAPALGIGFNATMFSFVNSFLLRPLPVSDPSRLVSLTFVRAGDFSNTSYPDYLDIRSRNQVFTNVAAAFPRGWHLRDLYVGIRSADEARGGAGGAGWRGRVDSGVLLYPIAGQPFVRHQQLAHHHIACVYALLGQADMAMAWLERTADTGFPCWPFFRVDPHLESLREMPEFQRLLADLAQQYMALKIRL